MNDNIAFSNGECSISDEKITCDLGKRLTDPDATVEIDMSSGSSAEVEIENGDVEFETNTRGKVELEGGFQNDEYLTGEGKIGRTFSNNEVITK